MSNYFTQLSAKTDEIDKQKLNNSVSAPISLYMSTNRISKADIIFFDVGHSNTSSELKSFITYLKTQKLPIPLIFSYVEGNPQMLSHLSLLENIFLDLPTFAKRNAKEDLVELIKTTGNDSLMCLYNQIKDVLLLPKDVNSNTIKLASIVKGLLKKSKYVFIDIPENHLMDYQLKTFAKAIEYNAKSLNQTIFIRTSFKIHFLNATKIIQRLPDGTFIQNIISSDVIRPLTDQDRLENPDGYLRFIHLNDINKTAA